MCLVSYVILQRIIVFEDEDDTFVKVVIQGMLDLFAGLEATDGGDLRGQGVQARSDFFDVGGRDA